VIFFDCEFSKKFLEEKFPLQILKRLFSIQSIFGVKTKFPKESEKKSTVEENHKRVSRSKFE
jgi:hypothetical protein